MTDYGDFWLAKERREIRRCKILEAACLAGVAGVLVFIVLVLFW